MTDRECLLMAYGALRVMNDDQLVYVIEEHLFGDKRSEPMPMRIEYVDKPTQPATRPEPSMQGIAFAQAPGEYRLKRSFLGKLDAKLEDVSVAKLESNIMRFYKFQETGEQALHPDVALDVQAAEKYLESLDTHAKSGEPNG